MDDMHLRNEIRIEIPDLAQFKQDITASQLMQLFSAQMEHEDSCQTMLTVNGASRALTIESVMSDGRGQIIAVTLHGVGETNSNPPDANSVTVMVRNPFGANWPWAVPGDSMHEPFIAVIESPIEMTEPWRLMSFLEEQGI